MASSIIFKPLTFPSHFSTSSSLTTTTATTTYASTFGTSSFVVPLHSTRSSTVSCNAHLTTAASVSRRGALTTLLSGCIAAGVLSQGSALAEQTVGFREYIDFFDGYSLTYPKNWIQVKGAGADIFFRDPYVLDENLSVDISSPSSSNYKSVADLGSPEEAGKKMLKQYLTEFMSTRLGVRRESEVLSTSSRVADDGRLYYLVEVNITSFANNNELAVMPEERVVRKEWDRRYISVLGVENNRLYELRLQSPENVFREEESDLRQVIASFRLNKVSA